MITIGLMRRTYGWISRLYQLAETWTEKASLMLFLLRFTVARLVPERLYKGNKEDVTLALQGATYVVGLRTTEIYTIEELFNDHDYDRLDTFIPKSDWTVFDIGANVGMFAIQQARRASQVYAFEPNPDCYRRLSRAIVENRLTDHITSFNYALGASSGVGTMRLYAGQTTAGSVVPGADLSSAQGARVRITSLDLLIPALALTHIDLLKINVEGAEVAVLDGAVRTLELVDRIVLEYHSAGLRQQVSTILNDRGFTQALQVDTNLAAGIGLIYAYRATLLS